MIAGIRRRRGIRLTDAKLKDETFYMSNMAPQVPTLNRQSWRMLEEKTRDWVKQFGHAYELTGPVFFDPKEEDAQFGYRDGGVQNDWQGFGCGANSFL